MFTDFSNINNKTILYSEHRALCCYSSNSTYSQMNAYCSYVVGVCNGSTEPVPIIKQSEFVRIFFFQQFLCYKLGKDFEPFNNQSQLDG